MKKLVIMFFSCTLGLASMGVAPANPIAGTQVLFTTNDGTVKPGLYAIPFIWINIDDTTIGFTGGGGDCAVMPAISPGIHKVDYFWTNGGAPAPGTIYGATTSYLLIPDQATIFMVRIPTIQVKFIAQKSANICLNQIWLGTAGDDGLLANLMSGDYTVTYFIGNKPPLPAWPLMPPYPGTPDPKLNGFIELCVGSADPYPVPAVPVQVILPEAESPNEPPVANAGTAQLVEQASPAGAAVTLDGSGSSDPDNDPLTYAWTWTGGSATGVRPTVTLPPGETTVTLLVNDGELDSAPASVLITVSDSKAPVPDVVPLPDLTGACSVTISQMPTATDIGDGNIIGTTTDPLEYKTQGTSTVNWIYKDKAGNTATQTQTVKVKDVTAPVPDVPALPALTGGCFITITEKPTATDACDGKITATTLDPLEYMKQGTFTITWTYKDKAGNLAMQTQGVKVQDVAPPTVTVSDPVCVNFWLFGVNKANKITLDVDDECSKYPVFFIKKIEIINSKGKNVGLIGTCWLWWDGIYFTPKKEEGWKVRITVFVRDENGNTDEVTITKSLIRC